MQVLAAFVKQAMRYLARAKLLPSLHDTVLVAILEALADMTARNPGSSEVPR